MIKLLKEFKLYQWIVFAVGAIFLLLASVYYLFSFSKSHVYNLDFSAIVTEESDNNDTLSVKGISIPKGHYVMDIAYVSVGNCEMYTVLDNEVSIGDTYSSTEGNIVCRRYEFDLKSGTDRGVINITCEKGKLITLAYVTIASSTPLYRDGQIWGIIGLLLIPIWLICIYYFGKSKYKMAIVATALLVAIEITPFILTHGFYRGCDTKAHMMRIEGIYYGLLDNQFPVVICPEWNNLYGQIDVLYPNVFLYIPALFRCLGMSQLGTVKLFTIMIVIASGIISYVSSRVIFKKDWQIMLACVGLMADYMRVHDLMRGGRLGGSLLADMFWPLIIAGLIDVFYREAKRWYLLAIGIAGVVCSHVVSATIGVMFIVVFSLFSIKRFKNLKVLKGIGKSICLFCVLILGTAISFVSFYFTDWGQDNLQWCDFVGSLWKISNPLFDKRWISTFVMFFICFGILIYSLIRLGKTEFFKSICKNYIMVLFLSGVVMLWMSTDLFPWAQLTKNPLIHYYTNMLQEGYRFLALASAAFSICVPRIIALYIYRTEKNRAIRSRVAYSTMAVLVALSAFNLGKEIKKNFYNPEVDVKLYYDEVVGEVEYCFEDYLPEGTQTEWYGTDTGYISDEEAVQSFDYDRSGTKIHYTYTNSKEGSYVEFPKFYYKGYEAVDELGNQVMLEKGDRNRIRAYLQVTEAPKAINITYRVPWHFTLSAIISGITWICVVLSLIVNLGMYMVKDSQNAHNTNYSEIQELVRMKSRKLLLSIHIF